MTDTITSPRQIPSSIEVSFAWTPAGTYTDPFSQAHPSASVNTVLTFTATTVIGNQGNDITGPLTIVEYRWDFGDGIYGYGNPATHTYILANFNAQTSLRVTDSKNRQWFTRAQMYLS